MTNCMRCGKTHKEWTKPGLRWELCPECLRNEETGAAVDTAPAYTQQLNREALLNVLARACAGVWIRRKLDDTPFEGGMHEAVYYLIEDACGDRLLTNKEVEKLHAMMDPGKELLVTCEYCDGYGETDRRTGEDETCPECEGESFLPLPQDLEVLDEKYFDYVGFKVV